MGFKYCHCGALTALNYHQTDSDFEWYVSHYGHTNLHVSCIACLQAGCDDWDCYREDEEDHA